MGRTGRRDEHAPANGTGIRRGSGDVLESPRFRKMTKNEDRMDRMDRRSTCGPWGRAEGSDGEGTSGCIERCGLNRRGTRGRPRPDPASTVESEGTESHGSSEGGECYRGGGTGPGRGCSSDDRRRTGLGDTMCRRGYGHTFFGLIGKKDGRPRRR